MLCGVVGSFGVLGTRDSDGMVKVVCGRCGGILIVFVEQRFVERDARMVRGILKRQTCWWCFGVLRVLFVK
jgi:hypothetical protein